MMKLLNTYDDRDEAEDAAEKITGKMRLASERDGTETVYNLFGQPSWGNFFRLGLFGLVELQSLLEKRDHWSPADVARHASIIENLSSISKNYEIAIPPHWL